MASITTNATRGLTSLAIADGKPPARLQPPHGVGLPSLPPPPHVASPSRPQNASYCRRIARNVIYMATGETTAQLQTELPEIVKTVQEAWDKVEDKYAVTGDRSSTSLTGRLW